MDPETDAGQALVPVREQTVLFYGDSVSAAQLADGTIWVPVRPICEHLGLDWSSQRQRINRDPVLSEGKGVVIITTPGGEQSALCLPLKLLPGWLFGINPSRVKDELRDKILRYQRDAYEALWNAFKGDIVPAAPAPTGLSGAELALEIAEAIASLARQQLDQEQRLADVAGRQDKIAEWARETNRRLTTLELQLSAGTTISEAEAAEIALAVKNVGQRFVAQGDKQGYASVYSEMYRRYRISSYKNLPAARYEEVLAWLHQWYEELI